MAAVPVALRSVPGLRWRRAVAAAIVLLLAVDVTRVALAPGTETVPGPVSPTVAFVLALRTFEQRNASLADQAVAQSRDPALRAAARRWAVDANRVSSRLWALLDRWSVPGADRLPTPDPSVAAGALRGPGVARAGATAGLRHACGLVGNDELAQLSLLTGAAFDQRVAKLWTEHTALALQALGIAGQRGIAGAPDLSAPGLGPVVRAAQHDLTTDLASLGALA